MPRATVFCGSAKPTGVTMSMCRSAADHLESMGYSAEVVVLSDLRIEHCTDCGACRHGPCVRKDDMASVYASFSDADLLVLASPIHFSGPSSLIKTAMDRFQTYWYDRSLKHPGQCLALLCGGSPEPRFEYTVSIFKAFSITTGMQWLGHLEFPDTDRVGDAGADRKVADFLDSVLRT